ncbi:helix-turn-helix transcriptional regulator [Streptomyces sp. NPDC001982]|uniref:helix-turn-helix transcriptional regulator n=1 Tax=Streptomyces sp. NPDC001982 TaxID=3154405 RepID=UPI0033174C2F
MAEARSILERARGHADRTAETIALRAVAEISAAQCRHADALASFRALRSRGASAVSETLSMMFLDGFTGSDRLIARSRRDTPNAGNARVPELILMRAVHHLGLGRLEGSAQALLSLLRLQDDLRQEAFRDHAHMLLSRIAYLRGDHDEARKWLRPRERSVRTDEHLRTTSTLIMNICLRRAEGDTTTALGLLRKHEETLLKCRFEGLVRAVGLPEWLLEATRLATRQGDQRLVCRALAGLERAEHNPTVPTAVGMAVQAAGLLHGDVDELTRTAALLATSPRPLVLATATWDLGVALLATGARKQAVAYLDDAWDGFHCCGAHGEAWRVRTVLRLVGARRKRMAPEPRPAFGWRALTPVERQVARHVAEGRTNRAAAVELGLSPNTVATHLRAIHRKLSVDTRVELALAVREAQLDSDI